jgi:nondiscriminating glutamyl-tRNA synthetase
MKSEENPNIAGDRAPRVAEVAVNPFTATDVMEILRERRWLAGPPSPEQGVWCERAASMLGPHAGSRDALADLLSLVFHYDAAELMTQSETHVTMSRYAARDVLRQLARLVLERQTFDSERFKVVVTELKERLEIRGRELFHPLRLALAGRAGEGELDRVVLLVDDAASLGFDAPVKTVRERALEFCAAFD